MSENFKYLWLALTQKFEANLILLHVFSETYSSDAGEARLLDMTREDAEREVARLEQQLRDQYSKCRSAFRIGSPFEQILREAADLKASLIVMASHCYGWLKELFLDEDLFSALEEIDLNPIAGSNRGRRKRVEFDHPVQSHRVLFAGETFERLAKFNLKDCMRFII
jgi:nucleotide-binding universal stress UspA family protein